MAGSSARRSSTWDRHVIARVSYQAETIECSCGELVTAPVDEFIRDRHAPLARAYLDHRIAVGAVKPSARLVLAYG